MFEKPAFGSNITSTFALGQPSATTAPSVFYFGNAQPAQTSTTSRFGAGSGQSTTAEDVLKPTNPSAVEAMPSAQDKPTGLFGVKPATSAFGSAAAAGGLGGAGGLFQAKPQQPAPAFGTQASATTAEDVLKPTNPSAVEAMPNAQDKPTGLFGVKPGTSAFGSAAAAGGLGGAGGLFQAKPQQPAPAFGTQASATTAEDVLKPTNPSAVEAMPSAQDKPTGLFGVKPATSAFGSAAAAGGLGGAGGLFQAKPQQPAPAFGTQASATTAEDVLKPTNPSAVEAMPSAQDKPTGLFGVKPATSAFGSAAAAGGLGGAGGLFQAKPQQPAPAFGTQASATTAEDVLKPTNPSAVEAMPSAQDKPTGLFGVKPATSAFGSAAAAGGLGGASGLFQAKPQQPAPAFGTQAPATTAEDVLKPTNPSAVEAMPSAQDKPTGLFGVKPATSAFGSAAAAGGLGGAGGLFQAKPQQPAPAFGTQAPATTAEDVLKPTNPSAVEAMPSAQDKPTGLFGVKPATSAFGSAAAAGGLGGASGLFQAKPQQPAPAFGTQAPATTAEDVLKPTNPSAVEAMPSAQDKPTGLFGVKPATSAFGSAAAAGGLGGAGGLFQAKPQQPAPAFGTQAPATTAEDVLKPTNPSAVEAMPSAQDKPTGLFGVKPATSAFGSAAAAGGLGGASGLFQAKPQQPAPAFGTQAPATTAEDVLKPTNPSAVEAMPSAQDKPTGLFGVKPATSAFGSAAAAGGLGGAGGLFQAKPQQPAPAFGTQASATTAEDVLKPTNPSAVEAMPSAQDKPTGLFGVKPATSAFGSAAAAGGLGGASGLFQAKPQQPAPAFGTQAPATTAEDVLKPTNPSAVEAMPSAQDKPTGLFGVKPATSAFGSAAAAGGLGGAGGLFQAKPQQPAPAFGTQAPATTAEDVLKPTNPSAVEAMPSAQDKPTGLFGVKPATSAFGSAAAAGGLGGASGLFQAKPQQPAPAFGTQAPATTAEDVLKPTNPSAVEAMPSAQDKPTGLFGVKPATSAFGSAAAAGGLGGAGGLFQAKPQQPAPAFGTQAPATTAEDVLKPTNPSAVEAMPSAQDKPTGLFGVKPATSAFGSAAAAGGLGGASGLFQAKPQQPAPAFGTQAPATTAEDVLKPTNPSAVEAMPSAQDKPTGLFGVKPATSAFGSAAAAGGLGGASGLFQAKPQQPAPAFGTQAPATRAEDVLKPTNPAAVEAMPNAQDKPTGLFSVKPATSAFGSAAAAGGLGGASGLFQAKPQQPAPAFGTQAPATRAEDVLKPTNPAAVEAMPNAQDKPTSLFGVKPTTSAFGSAAAAGGLGGASGLFQAKPQQPASAFGTQAPAPRTSCTGGTLNNLPPLEFHRVHEENVRISKDGSMARVVEPCIRAVAFSARPVRVNEKVYIRFVEIMTNKWFKGIGNPLGFTSHDPETFSHSFGEIDRLRKSGYWLSVLSEIFRKEENIVHYYVNSAGDVHFGVNGEDKGLFISGVDTKSPLWSYVEIFATCTIQFVDPRALMQMRRPNQNQSPLNEDRLVGSIRSLSVEESLPPLRNANPLEPLSLHRTKGRNVQFVNDRGVAARTKDELCQGYVFTEQPMRPGQTIVVQILSTEAAYAESLAFGFTSCDPATLRPCDLPDKTEWLLDRPEYWLLRRIAPNELRRGDELAVTLALDGEVIVSLNGSTPVAVNHVDHTLCLWAFVDIYGATQKVRMLRVFAETAPNGAGDTVSVVSLPPQNAETNIVGTNKSVEQYKKYIEEQEMKNKAKIATRAEDVLKPINPAAVEAMPNAQDKPTGLFGVKPATSAFGSAAAAGGLGGASGLFQAKPQQPASAFGTQAPAPRTSCTGGTLNNLPPLEFHRVHGEIVRISKDGSMARVVEPCIRAVAFSARPVRVNEKVYIRFVEIMTNKWFKGIGNPLGFTSHDPETFSHSLGEIDRLRKSGYWLSVLSEIFRKEENIVHYYVNSAGDVHFGVNGEDKGLFISGVDTKSPLWSYVEIFATCTIQFVDPRALMQMRRPNQNQSPLNEDRLVGSMRSLSVEESLPPLRNANPLEPLSLHRTKGRNVQFVNDRGVAARTKDELCQGYVFTEQPMRPGQTIVVQILSTEAAYAESLAFGFTSCDPATLRPCDLPDKTEWLLDRPEYWLLRRIAPNELRRGDELAVTLALDGEVIVSLNGSTPVAVNHVDHTLCLWAFVDIYGATQKVRMLRVFAETAPNGAGDTVSVVSLPPQNAETNIVGTNKRVEQYKKYIEEQEMKNKAKIAIPTANASSELMLVERDQDREPELETVEIEDAEPKDPISLPTCSDEDDVIIVEPHIETVDVSSEEDEDDNAALRTPCTGGTPNNLPPLEFHSVHGLNITLSRDGFTASVVKDSFMGVTFSARPVRVNEKVYIRFVQILTRNNVFCFGFTRHEPAVTFSLILRKCHETHRQGNWSKRLDERFFEKDNIVHYYVNSAGDVHFGVNGEDKGLLFSGVDTKSPLWSFVKIFATCTIQFVDPRALMQMRRPNQNQIPLNEDRLRGSMRPLSVEESLPPSTYANPLEPLSLHRTKGRNVQFVNEFGVAARTEDESCQGYVFTERPIRPGQTIVVQILSTEAAYADSLAFGLTSCDPATLRPCDLPDNAEWLMDRPEYWVVLLDAANGLRRGDELTVTLFLDGEVIVSRNRSTSATVIQVDHTVPLWAFVDIFGATQKVRMLSSQAITPPEQWYQQPRRANSQRSSQNSLNEQAQIPNKHAEPLRISERIPNGPSTSRQPPPKYSVIDEGTCNLTDTDCIICYENPRDSVLYVCGHVCMCYSCAVQQWKGKGGGQCPLCRVKIKDVIRTYMS